MNNSIVFVKEAVLSALGALAECCQDEFSKVFDDVINLLFNIFQNTAKKEYKQLICNSMETITVIGKCFPYTKFQKFENQVI